mmetsp:Transcript_7772/g.18821  ORF Transcript_7772/g.18821 Transcript_7772/m.18821 type:complete len:327 (-) Transcript_7772:109-1089(-)
MKLQPVLVDFHSVQSRHHFLHVFYAAVDLWLLHAEFCPRGQLHFPGGHFEIRDPLCVRHDRAGIWKVPHQTGCRLPKNVHRRRVRVLEDLVEPVRLGVLKKLLVQALNHLGGDLRRLKATERPRSGLVELQLVPNDHLDLTSHFPQPPEFSHHLEHGHYSAEIALVRLQRHDAQVPQRVPQPRPRARSPVPVRVDEQLPLRPRRFAESLPQCVRQLDGLLRGPRVLLPARGAGGNQEHVFRDGRVEPPRLHRNRGNVNEGDAVGVPQVVPEGVEPGLRVPLLDAVLLLRRVNQVENPPAVLFDHARVLRGAAECALGQVPELGEIH